ncbi:pseudouridine synthase [Hydrogenophaga sp. MI9]|uniref:pseudouridine synthase n=1 Tax=Hydrogenophaga sp. MI9 TaxID=3453719 RepID=UPI003EEC61E7
MTDTPKKTLQLKAQPAAAKPAAPRAPVRPRGPARARPLSEVQAERAKREAAWAAQRPEGGDRSDRAERADAPRGAGPRGRDDAPRGYGPRGGGPRADAPRLSNADKRPTPPSGPRSAPEGMRPARPPRDARPDLARVGNVNGEVRLNKRMADLGLCSRREADEWIARGWVLVNGQPAVMGQPVPPDAQVEVLPQARHQQAGQVTILLHKPVGYVSGQPEDGHEAAATLIGAPSQWRGDARTPSDGRRFAPEHTRGLAPCGRLDIDSTGLLVLTQDGRIARQLIGENSGIEKEYLVRVQWAPNGPQGAGLVTQNVQAIFPPEQLARLRHGLSLDEQPLKPAQVDWMNPEQLRFVLQEGKKRQIRRMCEQVGLHVVGLKRIRIGNVVLGNLPVGQWRYLGANEGF